MINIKPDKYIIYEGITEEKFLKKLEKEFFSNFNIIYINAKGKDNIIKKYQNLKKKNIYNDVAVMYDLDGIDTIKSIIKQYFEKGIVINKKEIYFINPKFELIFVLVKEKKTPIDKYEIYIKRLYKVDNYEKTDKQLTTIINSISKEELVQGIHNIDELLSNNDNNLRSSNYNKLFRLLFKL